MSQLGIQHPSRKAADRALGTAVLRTIAHKFGGSSLATANHFRHVAKLLVERPDFAQITVVSAMHGATNALVAAGEELKRGDRAWKASLEEIERRHRNAAVELLMDRSEPVCTAIRGIFASVCDRLASQPERSIEELHGLGEVLSALLLTETLRAENEDVAMLDARELLVVSHGHLGAIVDWAASGRLLAAWRARHPQRRVIVTGFVARDAAGHAVTLGRNGSDYSGAIFAALFGASELHIWTDVDGVLSADPRIEPDAVILPSLSYREACELAYFGAKVVHPQTMFPAMSRSIPIFIRNTARPELGGTRIAEAQPDAMPVKGVTLVGELALLNIEGAGMIGVPGTAERVFRSLHGASVSVMMISQGSSEHSICCVIREVDGERSASALRAEFAAELESGELEAIELRRGVSVLAAVGEGMAGTPGIAARLFSSLSRARVNVRAIAQGSSERNISVAVASDEATRALRAAHAAFWLSPQTVSLGIIGPGRVGSALLEQLRGATPRLRSSSRLDLRLRAVAGRSAMSLRRGDRAEDLGVIEMEQGCDLDRFAAHLSATHLPHVAIIDCSGDDQVASRYEKWLAAGMHVITPSKHAGAGPFVRYRAIREAEANGGRFRYEATVGAGLPIIQTLRDLLDTGDRLHAIDGILSGTLAWLFNRYDATVPFSQLIREAHGLGYTEPDPRDDLSGVDVARKLVILAREAGGEIEVDDVEIESLVPAPLKSAAREEFMEGIAEFDDVMAQRYHAAAAAGQVLRYVAALREGKASVRLAMLPRDHPFAHLRLTDNIVQYTTDRYRDNPLVVQGPGAGPDVTAGAVFADLLRVVGDGGTRG
jgi:bifunctional aspartokinase / homoserine dehydrogenase 1